MKLIYIKKYLDSLYPENLKASFDNVGLMVGSLDMEVKKILLSLDLTREVMDEAINNKVDLIITHHPLLFHPLKMINLDDDPGSIVRDLIKYNISNYSLHTNFDVVKMNDYLSSLINIANKCVLSVEDQIGIFGDVEEMDVLDYIKIVNQKLNIPNSRYYGDSSIKVKKVGIIGGSGSSYFNEAKSNKLDLYITGDVSYSRAIEAKRMSLNVLDVGHHIEHLFTNVIVEDLKTLNSNLEVIVSKISPVPYIEVGASWTV